MRESVFEVLLAGLAGARLGTLGAAQRLGRCAAAAALVGLGVYAALAGSRAMH